MISFDKDLRFGEEISSERKRKKLKKKIYRRKLTMSAFVVAFPSNDANLLDIIDAKEFMFPYYKNADVHVLGIAGSKDGAVSLATDIIDEVYAKTEGFDIRGYYEKRD